MATAPAESPNSKTAWTQKGRKIARIRIMCRQARSSLGRPAAAPASRRAVLACRPPAAVRPARRPARRLAGRLTGLKTIHETPPLREACSLGSE